MMKPDLLFLIPSSKLILFYFLLQQGIHLKTLVGEGVHDFLLNRLELPPEDIEEKIQTVFLNGRVVDDLDKALIKDGAALALSGALPGLVGATMRRGGFYSSFRNPIKYQDEERGQGLQEGTILLKLFNLLLKDLGPRLLSKGFLVESSQLQEFLKRNESELGDTCRVRLDNGSEFLCRDFSIALPEPPGKTFFVQGTH